MSAWLSLFVAGILEAVWAVSMKASNGFSKPLESVVTLVAMVASFWLLAMAMKVLPLGTAYAVWTGIGTVLAFIVGIVWMGEPASALCILAATMIIGGIILLRVATPGSAT